MKGCERSNDSTADTTICECNHLTHFALLLSPAPPEVRFCITPSHSLPLPPPYKGKFTITPSPSFPPPPYRHNDNLSLPPPPHLQFSEEETISLEIIGIVGVTVSLLALTITIATFIFLRYTIYMYIIFKPSGAHRASEANQGCRASCKILAHFGHH